jgi:PAS domain S-box-containing protein
MEGSAHRQHDHLLGPGGLGPLGGGLYARNRSGDHDLGGAVEIGGYDDAGRGSLFQDGGQFFGLQPQEFGATYEAFLERVHPDDRAAVDAAYIGSLRENRDTYELDHRVIRKDTGEIRIVHEKCEHFRDAAGRIIRSVGMVHDITERKRAQEQLLKLNRTLQALSKSNQALMHATEESAYLQEVCKIIVGDCGHAMVWIGYAEEEEAKRVRPVACAGFDEGYLETLRSPGPIRSAVAALPVRNPHRPASCLCSRTRVCPWRGKPSGGVRFVVLPCFPRRPLAPSHLFARPFFSQDEMNCRWNWRATRSGSLCDCGPINNMEQCAGNDELAMRQAQTGEKTR